MKQQWETKRKFALDADRQSRQVLEAVLGDSSKPDPRAKAIQVYNTNSWPRTDVVFLSPKQSSSGDHVFGPAAEPLWSQRLSTGELAVLVKNIPPFSAETLTVGEGNSDTHDGAKIEGNVLENDFLSASIDPKAGTMTSLKSKKNGLEFVDSARGGLGEYLYVSGTDAQKAQHLWNVHVRTKERGDLIVSVLVEGDALGAKHFSSECDNPP